MATSSLIGIFLFANIHLHPSKATWSNAFALKDANVPFRVPSCRGPRSQQRHDAQRSRHLRALYYKLLGTLSSCLERSTTDFVSVNPAVRLGVILVYVCCPLFKCDHPGFLFCLFCFVLFCFVLFVCLFVSFCLTLSFWHTYCNVPHAKFQDTQSSRICATCGSLWCFLSFNLYRGSSHAKPHRCSSLRGSSSFKLLNNQCVAFIHIPDSRKFKFNLMII